MDRLPVNAVRDVLSVDYWGVVLDQQGVQYSESPENCLRLRVYTSTRGFQLSVRGPRMCFSQTEEDNRMNNARTSAQESNHLQFLFCDT